MALMLLLSACGGPGETVAPADLDNRVERGSGTPPGDPAERVACSASGAAVADACTVERTRIDGGELLTVRHSDGAFRRLRVAADGRITVADGAVPAAVTMRDGLADVAVGSERYQISSPRP